MLMHRLEIRPDQLKIEGVLGSGHTVSSGSVTIKFYARLNEAWALLLRNSGFHRITLIQKRN